MTAFDNLLKEMPKRPRTWLVTGVAGFIGSNLLETLLKLDQAVVGLDNFATGHQHNLDEVKALVSADQWSRFKFIEGDIRNLDDCKNACSGVDYILHQAALGSVPRSVDDPIATNTTNIDGFLNMLIAARDEEVERFVYAASSSTYGDSPSLPKVEALIGNPLSPYAVTKYVNELYADVFNKTYGLNTIGLRYFNVFGERQDPTGGYAAVIPKWIASLIDNKPIYINGDGGTTRDFCYVKNAIQANLLSATTLNKNALNEVFNVALGDQTSLNILFSLIRDKLQSENIACGQVTPIYREFRVGDVRHSLADITKARRLIGYEPSHNINNGLEDSINWYLKKALTLCLISHCE